MKINYLLNGFPVNPVKREDISLEINHDQESVINQPKPHVGINNLYFAREDIKYIMSLLNQAPGITEGIPFDIKITERGQTEIINMYIDCMNGFERSNDGIAATVKMLQSLDWLDDKVDSFTYESMYNETGVAPFIIDSITYNSYQDFFDRKTIFIPYIISSIPNYQDAFMAIFGITFVAVQLAQTIKDIINLLTPSVSAVGPVVHIAQLVAEIAYSILLIATLIAFVTQLINCLVQPVKYHGAMLMSDLLKVTGVKLGLHTQSSIWDAPPFNQVAYMPEKYNPVEVSGNIFSLMGFNVGGYGAKGYTSPAYAPTSSHNSETAGIQHGYYNGTGGDFLRLIKSMCNGKISIPDGTNDLVLERRDYFSPSTPFQLKNIRQDWNGYNTDELIANIIIKFAVDLNERNCIDFIDASGNPFYPGTILQATHQQITTTNKLLVGLKGLREINIACARGAAKDTLTFIEQAVKDLEVVYKAIVDAGILIIDAAIIVIDAVIIVINAVIAVLNAIISAIVAVIDVVLSIIDAIVSLFGGDGPDQLDVDDFQIPSIPTIPLIEFIPLTSDFGDNRMQALLLENDIVETPKLLLVDISRSEFTNSRIAYLHSDNANTINAKYLWDKFYFIDAFVGNPHNRFTKISPALNKPDEINPATLSLSEFRNLVSNSQFLDNWGEKVIADSIQWYPERNGKAEFQFRKNGWLKNPQHPNGVTRALEININIQLKISIPNGQ